MAISPKYTIDELFASDQDYERLVAPMYTIEELFASDQDWARLHDVLVEVGMGSVTMEQAKQVFFELPEDVKNIAFLWGIGDTVFGDKVYEHLINLENK